MSTSRANKNEETPDPATMSEQTTEMLKNQGGSQEPKKESQDPKKESQDPKKEGGSQDPKKEGESTSSDGTGTDDSSENEYNVQYATE